MIQDKNSSWAQHIAEWNKSGKTQRAYCRDNDLSYWVFRDYLKRQRKQPSFVKISAQPAQIISKTDTDSIIVCIDEQIRIVLPVNYSREQFRNILEDAGVRPCE